ncbi:hypothetical protein PAT3040_02923 [Paenibacillus agaridevorans]|uniref:AB hydrolase-1 domain-containing protein n=1 Tax=Paenibacillus agaridevorans TaxID=171404 RepID=A0A2R5EWZ7_9BACL|nr:alpha/beta hydrolase [Paenibacillus agaridevorans]GBG08343.1 hypothetical protein PAT3040_02923 [Paenibacillus agaridevorans]
MVQIFKNEKMRQEVLSSYDEVLQMWGTEIEVRNVETRFGTTHCLIAGRADNPPLLLFHGVGDNSALMWALNMKELSRRFYCIAVDTLGGPGKSVPNEWFVKGSFSQLEWLDDVADHFGLRTTNVAGVSNGAYLAYQYTVARPERVRKAVCLEGGMVVSPIQSMFRTIMLMFPEMLIPTDRNLRKIIPKLCSPASRVFDEHPLLASHLVLLMKGHNQKAMFPHQPRKYISEQGMALKDKLYFLVGDHHAVVGKAFIELLKRDGYRYKMISKAGHAINQEQPESVHKEMFGFLLGDNLEKRESSDSPAAEGRREYL